MGSGDTVKYIVAYSRILKLIIAKWEYIPTTTTPNKPHQVFLHSEYVQVQCNLF